MIIAAATPYKIRLTGPAPDLIAIIAIIAGIAKIDLAVPAHFVLDRKPLKHRGTEDTEDFQGCEAEQKSSRKIVRKEGVAEAHPNASFFLVACVCRRFGVLISGF